MNTDGVLRVPGLLASLIQSASSGLSRPLPDRLFLEWPFQEIELTPKHRRLGYAQLSWILAIALAASAINQDRSFRSASTVLGANSGSKMAEFRSPLCLIQRTDLLQSFGDSIDFNVINLALPPDVDIR
jgi:hypothetical protein